MIVVNCFACFCIWDLFKVIILNFFPKAQLLLKWMYPQIPPLNYQSNCGLTYNVGCSNMHLIVVLLCLGCPGDLGLILNLQHKNSVRVKRTLVGTGNGSDATLSSQIINTEAQKPENGRGKEGEGTGSTYLCSFDNFREVVQDGLDVIFQSLVVVLQQSLFALREHSLRSHNAQVKGTQRTLSIRIKSRHANNPISSTI